MKKLLTLCLFTSLSCLAQYDAYLVSVKPDTFCYGQYCAITIHMDTGLYYNPNNMGIMVYDSTYVGTPDRVGVIYASRQEWIDSGFVLHKNIFQNYGNNNMGIWFGFQNDTKRIQINNCIADIKHYNSVEDLISTEYFNLLGQLIIEPNGITVEVKTFKGGKKEVRKIIM